MTHCYDWHQMLLVFLIRPQSQHLISKSLHSCRALALKLDARPSLFNCSSELPLPGMSSGQLGIQLHRLVGVVNGFKVLPELQKGGRSCCIQLCSVGLLCNGLITTMVESAASSLSWSDSQTLRWQLHLAGSQACAQTTALTVRFIRLVLEPEEAAACVMAYARCSLG